MEEFCSLPPELYGIFIQQSADIDKFDVYFRIVTTCWNKLRKEDIMDLFWLTIVREKGDKTQSRQGYYHDGNFVYHSINRYDISPAFIVHTEEEEEDLLLEEYHLNGKLQSFKDADGIIKPAVIKYDDYNGHVQIEEFYDKGRRQSFEGVDGIIKPALLEYDDLGNVLREEYYDNDKLQSYIDEDGFNLKPAIIKNDADYGHVTYMEYYNNGKLQSFQNNDGQMMPARIVYSRPYRIKIREYYDDGKLHSFSDENGNRMPAIIEYDKKGKIVRVEYYDHDKQIKL